MVPQLSTKSSRAVNLCMYLLLFRNIKMFGQQHAKQAKSKGEVAALSTMVLLDGSGVRL